MKPNIYLVGSTCLFAGIWIGAMANKEVKAQSPTSQTIIARAIKLYDAQGRQRIVLDADTLTNHQAVINMTSPDGQGILMTDGANDKPVISLSNKKTVAVMLQGGDTQPGICVNYPDSGNPGVTLVTKSNAAYAFTYDPSGKITGHIP